MQVFAFMVYDRSHTEPAMPIAAFLFEKDAHDFIRKARGTSGNLMLVNTIKGKCFAFIGDEFHQMPD